MEKSYSLKQLEELSDGSKDFILEIISVFLSEIPEQVTMLLNAFNKNDFDELTRIAHKLKPSIDLLEINSITKDIRIIEDYSKSGININQLYNVIVNIQTTLNETSNELKSDFNIK